MEFEQIYSAYFQSVYHYVRQLSGSASVAEEITSETFFKAIQSIDRFRGDCDMRVWLCQIAKNTYGSDLKKRRKTADSDEWELQNVRRIRKALYDMAEPYKGVFMWRVLGELSFKEIAELYGKTDNWACVTYHRARRLIQRRLEESEHES